MEPCRTPYPNRIQTSNDELFSLIYGYNKRCADQQTDKRIQDNNPFISVFHIGHALQKKWGKNSVILL